jgi:hypothetical protein
MCLSKAELPIARFNQEAWFVKGTNRRKAAKKNAQLTAERFARFVEKARQAGLTPAAVLPESGPPRSRHYPEERS